MGRRFCILAATEEIVQRFLTIASNMDCVTETGLAKSVQSQLDIHLVVLDEKNVRRPVHTLFLWNFT
jgi:hypothetical protein